MYCGIKMWLNQNGSGLGRTEREGAAHGFYCACLLTTAKFRY